MHGAVRSVMAVVAGAVVLDLCLTFLPPAGVLRVAYAPVSEYRVPPPPPPPKPQMLGAKVYSQPGRIESFTFDSVALNSRKTVNLYLPPGYDEGDNTYPVIYLLRGHQSEWTDVSNPLRKGRGAQQIADQLIMSGAIPPVILAMPPLSSDDRKVITLGINLPNPKRAGDHPGVGPGRFEEFLVREVIPEIDRRYRTIPLREYRGVDGFSLGGFAGVSLALRFPELFASVGAYEPSFLWPGGRRPDGRIDETITQDMAVTFGDPPDLELVQRYNPIDLIGAMPPEQLRQFTFHLQSAQPGSGDSARVDAFLTKLAAKGVTNSFTPPNITGGRHGWYWADEHLIQVLPKHLSTFAAAK